MISTHHVHRTKSEHAIAFHVPLQSGTGMACPLLRQTSVQSCKRLNLEIEESQRPDVLVEEEGEAADPDQEQIMSPFHRLPGRSNRSAANRSQYHSIRRATSRRYCACLILENLLYLLLIINFVVGTSLGLLCACPVAYYY